MAELVAVSRCPGQKYGFSEQLANPGTETLRGGVLNRRLFGRLASGELRCEAGYRVCRF